MRIYNADADQKTNNVSLYLTLSEAQEMRDALEILITNENHHHEHISDEDYKREITVCIYRQDHLSDFDERSKKLILNDE